MSADTSMIMFMATYIAAQIHYDRKQVATALWWGAASLFFLWLALEKIGAIP